MLQTLELEKSNDGSIEIKVKWFCPLLQNEVKYSKI